MDEHSIEKFQNLVSLRLKLYKINLLISMDAREEEIRTLKQLAKDLAEMIAAETQSVTKSSKEFPSLSMDLIEPNKIGHLCKAFYQEHGKWYFAEIKEIDFNEQIITVSFIGYDEELSMSSIFVRLVTPLGKERVKEGAEVAYIDDDSGKVFKGIVQRIENAEVIILNSRTNLTESVKPKHVLNISEYVEKTYENKPKDGIIPDSLKIAPNDTREERLIKKKKIKKIKYEQKTKEVNNFYQEKQNSWLNFKRNIPASTKSVFARPK